MTVKSLSFQLPKYESEYESGQTLEFLQKLGRMESGHTLNLAQKFGGTDTFSIDCLARDQ